MGGGLGCTPIGATLGAAAASKKVRARARGAELIAAYEVMTGDQVFGAAMKEARPVQSPQHSKGRVRFTSGLFA